MGIKTVIREYYEKLYGYKFDDIDEMDQFLKKISTTKTNIRRKT